MWPRDYVNGGFVDWNQFINVNFAQCGDALRAPLTFYLTIRLYKAYVDVVKHKGTNPHDHKKWDFCSMTSPVHQSSLKKIDLDD